MDLNKIIERNGMRQENGVWCNQTHVLCVHKPSNRYEVIGKDSLKLAQSNGYELYIKAIEPPKEAFMISPAMPIAPIVQTAQRGRKPNIK